MIVDDILSHVRAKYCLKAILLHGSRAREDAFDQSDYDLALITDNPKQIRPENYKGWALDISGIAPKETILMSGQTPLWPCLVLYDDADGLGECLARRTHEVFVKGPAPLTKDEWENRHNFLKRLINRIQNRGHDPLIRFYYMGDFYQRILRYWCELNRKWPMPVHLLLPYIAAEDPAFYQMLQDMWADEDKDVILRIHQHLFERTPQKQEKE